jgi:hypothetical protein
MLTVGAEVLRKLQTPKTVSALWEDLRSADRGDLSAPELTYDWFVLVLDFLFAVNAVEISSGLLARTTR